MCFITFAFDAHPRYALIFAANRDEFYDRPTAPAAFWEDAPDLLAGRDLKGGGTWMGITQGGRFAALTNYREPGHYNPEGPSRGVLVKNYLCGDASAKEYLNRLHDAADHFNGYNLLVGTPDELQYYSNRDGPPRRLTPGVHGLSNHLLDTPWPKVVRGKERLRTLLEADAVTVEALLELLADRTPADPEALPETGVGEEWEQVLSPIFIESPAYGTRSATVVLIDRAGAVTFVERTFPAHDEAGTPVTRRFDFVIEPDPPNA
ncbi:MAG: hypothetical protein GVY18_17815 [Bacteroidetes bacterium]|jgi:uncharacterized protein with NRDE domain|nr:hypothetical protein [Bacteroidota bacterium]